MAESGVPEKDVPKYKGLFQTAKEKVEKLKDWKEKVDKPTQEFDEELKKVLRYCGDVFDILRDDQQFDELGDKLADVIVEVRDHLGQSIMPLDRYHMFSRGVFEVGRQTVISGQYYEEIPYYGPPRPAGQDQGGIMEITKFYEWKIIDSPRAELASQASFPVMCIYHLEKGEMMEPYYVLGKTAPGMHATIQMYPGNSQPRFVVLEARIARMLLDQQQGNQTDFAAASFHPARRQPDNEAEEEKQKEK